jgi:hypothetical protein
MKKLISLFTLFFCWNSMLSQHIDTKNELSVTIGATQTSVKDLNFSPLLYQGGGSSYLISYERVRSSDDVLHVGLGYSLANIDAENLEFSNVTNYEFNIRAHYLFCLSDASKKLKYFVGSGISAHVDYVDFEEFDALTYFNLYSIDALAQLTYKISQKSVLQSTIKLPITGLLVRPKHTGWDHTVSDASALEIITDGDFSSIGNFVFADIDLLYKYQLFNKLALQLQGTYRYKQTDKTDRVASLKFQLLTGLIYNF